MSDRLTDKNEYPCAEILFTVFPNYLSAFGDDRVRELELVHMNIGD
jgi:hypothetical protein